MSIIGVISGWTMPSKIQRCSLLVRLAIVIAALASLELETQAENAPAFLWAKQGVTTNGANAYRVAVDASGSVFVAGSFRGRLDLGSTNLVSHGYYFHGAFVSTLDDIFVAKYDKNGAVLWARSAGGDGDDHAVGMALDTGGNCYLTGSFQDIADFGGFSITNTFTGNSGGLFLAKYDAQGNVLWVRKATGQSVGGSGVALAPQGNIFVTGTFAQTAVFENLSISTPPAVNIFVAKFDSSGIPLWVRQASPNSFGYGVDVAADRSGNCYITGFYNTTATFGGVTLIASTNATGIFLVRYDPNGNVVWARQGAGPRPSGGSVSDAGEGVGVDLLGNVYLSGVFSGVITFDRFTLTNVGGTDIFLAKYNSLGNVLWLRQGGGAGDEWTHFSAVDSSGDVYLTGNFHSDPITFDGSSFTNSGNYGLYLAKYDSAGNFRGLVQCGGKAGYNMSFATAVDGLGNSYMAGTIASTSGLFGTNTLSSGSGNSTFFVAKLEPFPPTLNVKQSPAGVVFGWPLWAKNYELESTASVPAIGAWSPVTNGPSAVDGENVVTNANTNPMSYFRLRRQ